MANIPNEQTSRASQNAGKHWCTSSQALIIGDEKIEDFDALVTELIRDCRPRNDMDRQWVEGAARSVWFVRRNSKAFDNVFNRLCARGGAFESWDEIHQTQYKKVLTYRHADQRAFERGWRGVQYLRANRVQRTKLKTLVAKAKVSIEKEKKWIEVLNAKNSRADAPATVGPTPPHAPVKAPPAGLPHIWDQRVPLAFEWMIAPNLTAEEERCGEFLEPANWRPQPGEDLPRAA